MNLVEKAGVSEKRSSEEEKEERKEVIRVTYCCDYQQRIHYNRISDLLDLKKRELMIS